MIDFGVEFFFGTINGFRMNCSNMQAIDNKVAIVLSASVFST